MDSSINGPDTGRKHDWHSLSTADNIIAIMEDLIETRGYSAVSYQDIANRIGIRKASIHHHFPTKASLGVAVIERYREQLQQIMAQAEQNKRVSDALEAYFSPFANFAKDPDRICLCGALAGEFPALPDEMKTEVSRFFEQHQLWLEQLIRLGIKTGEFAPPVSAREAARDTFSALQGALIIRRATGEGEHMQDVFSSIRASLSPQNISP